MRNWGQLIIILAVFLLPLLSKIVQSIVEQYKAKQERDKREQTSRNPGDSALVDRREEQRQEKQLAAHRRDENRREELARRRQAQLEAWRARKSGRMPAPSSLQTRVGTPPPAVVPTNVLSSQSGEQLIADMLAQRTQQAKRVQQQRQSQTSRAHASAPQQANQQRRTSKQGHIQNPNDNEVHRRVFSNEDKLSWAKMSSGRSLVEMSASNGSESIATPSVLRSIMHSPAALRNAFVLKELLDPPLALRK